MTDDQRRALPVPPPTRRDRIREAMNERLPEGTMARRCAERALTALRAARSLVPLRYGGTRRKPEREYPYAQWLDSRRSAPRPASSRPAERGSVLVVAFVQPDTSATSLERTAASVRSQHGAVARLEVVDADAVEWSPSSCGADLETFVIIVRAGDVIEADTARRVLDAWWRRPDVELVSWDDDLGATSPRFRDGWAPDTLLCFNTLGRSFALRADMFTRSGGFHPTDGDAAWWDLVLRSDLDDSRVEHIPDVLGHLAVRPLDAPDGADAFINHWLERHGWPAKAVHRQTHIDLEWTLDSPPSVSIIVPSRCNRPMLERLLPSLEATDYPNFDVVIVDNSGHSEEKASWYRDHTGTLDLRVMWWTEEPFNYSAVNNAGAAATTGAVLVFLNDDTEALSHDWLTNLVGWATRDGVGVVGAQLLFEDGTLQHAGVRLSHHGMADHYFLKLAPGTETVAGPAGFTRTVSAVTGACAALERRLFDEIGGFDERLVLTGNDVELSIDALRSGARNVLTSGARLRHFESVTRGNTTVWDDTFRSYWRFRHWIAAGDPRFSPNLRIIGPEPSWTRPWDPTPLQLMEQHFHRRLDPRLDDDLPAPAIQAAWNELPAAAHRRVDGPLSTVVWVASHLTGPTDPHVEIALEVAARLAHMGIESVFAVAAIEDPLWFGSIVSGASRSAPVHRVVHLGPHAERPLPDGDALVAIDPAIRPLVAADARRGLAIAVDPDEVIRDLDLLCNNAATASAHAALGGRSLVIEPHIVAVPRPAPAPGGPAAQPTTTRSIIFDVDVAADRVAWEATIETVGSLKAQLGTGIRLVVSADELDEAVKLRLGDAEIVIRPDERSLWRYCQSGDLVVCLSSPLTQPRRARWWRAATPDVAVASAPGSPEGGHRRHHKPLSAPLVQAWLNGEAPIEPLEHAEPVDPQRLIDFLRGT